MCIVLDTGEDRFAPLIRALEHGFATYDCVDFVVGGRRYAEADGPYRRGEIVDLVAECSIEGFVGASPRVEAWTELKEELPDSTEADAKLGKVVVRVDGVKVGQSPLVARMGYREAPLSDRVWYTVEGFFE